MMIPVQKDEGLLVNHNEKRIHQFGEFGEDKELHPETGGSRSVRYDGVGAEVVAEGHGGEVVEEVGGCSARTDY